MIVIVIRINIYIACNVKKLERDNLITHFGVVMKVVWTFHDLICRLKFEPSVATTMASSSIARLAWMDEPLHCRCNFSSALFTSTNNHEACNQGFVYFPMLVFTPGLC